MLAYSLIQNYFDISYKSMCKIQENIFPRNQVTNSPHNFSNCFDILVPV